MATFLLKKLLKSRGLSQGELGRRVKKSKTQVKRYLEPGYDPKLSVMAAVAKALGCKISDLYKE